MMLPKPLLRGWFHAGAAVGAVALTLAFCWRSRSDGPRLLSLLIFGLSMIELYTVSAIYHIGNWRARADRALQRLDHANIPFLIAGTYTPICFNVLTDWARLAFLTAVWALAGGGIVLAFYAGRVPRGLRTGLYIGMGWVAVLGLPLFWTRLPPLAIMLLVAGGLLNTGGALIYARQRPNPFPRVLGFHELFHLCVVAGGAAFATMIWVWVVPFPRV